MDHDVIPERGRDIGSGGGDPAEPSHGALASRRSCGPTHLTCGPVAIISASGKIAPAFT
jgi:hypothetical protein